MLKRIIRQTQPAIEPVSLLEAKEQLKVEHNIDDQLIQSYISAARDRVEQYCNQYFTESDFRLVYVGLTGLEVVELPFPVETVNTAGLTLDADLNEVTPTTDWDSEKSNIDVTTAFYAPESIKQSILLYMSDYYEHRMSQQETQLYENVAAMQLANPYRINMGI